MANMNKKHLNPSGSSKASLNNKMDIQQLQSSIP